MMSPDGLVVFKDFITEDAEVGLLDRCSLIWRGTRKLPRQIQNDRRSECVRFGTRIYRDQPIDPVIPSWLVDLGASLPMATPDSVTVNLWPHRASLAPHIDKGGPVVCALSLLSDGVLAFSNGHKTHQQIVPRRALMVMAGEARRVWRHGVDPCASRRISIVFRTYA